MNPDSHLTRRQLLRWSRAGVLACAGISVALPACELDNNFTIFGYTTAPNYDPKYKTVRVPIFQNKTYRRNLEYDLTKAVITQIEAITPMKVVTCDADTELIGTITMTNKNILNINQLNEIREGEAVITIELVWRDLHTGEILTRPGKRPTDSPPFEPLVPPAVGVNGPGTPQMPFTVPPVQPTQPGQAIASSPPESSDPAFRQPPATLDPLSHGPPQVPPFQPAVIPLKIAASASFVPEVGQSTTSAYQTAINKLAVQIVSAMEKPQ
jgi:hypothetical protein